MNDRSGPISGESLLFLTDEQLRQGIEAMFFAYRGFTADPDRILEDLAYGRAHHRAVHFINRAPGTPGWHALNVFLFGVFHMVEMKEAIRATGERV